MAWQLTNENVYKRRMGIPEKIWNFVCFLTTDGHLFFSFNAQNNDKDNRARKYKLLHFHDDHKLKVVCSFQSNF